MHKVEHKKFHVEFFYELNRVIKMCSVPHLLSHYAKDQVIALSADRCQHVGIVIKGEVKIEHVTENGTRVLIKQLNQYDIFGEILLFSNHPQYPYDIIAKNNCEILFITKENLLKIFIEDLSILENYLKHISESYLKLNQLLKLKSQKTIRDKLAYYFIHFAHVNKDKPQLIIKNKTELANLLGVERQSLVRELKRLMLDGYITINKKQIIMTNLPFFQNLAE